MGQRQHMKTNIIKVGKGLPWRFDSEGQLSHKPTFKITRLTSAPGTLRTLLSQTNY